MCYPIDSYRYCFANCRISTTITTCSYSTTNGYRCRTISNGRACRVNRNCCICFIYLYTSNIIGTTCCIGSSDSIVCSRCISGRSASNSTLSFKSKPCRQSRRNTVSSNNTPCTSNFIQYRIGIIGCIHIARSIYRHTIGIGNSSTTSYIGYRTIGRYLHNRSSIINGYIYIAGSINIYIGTFYRRNIGNGTIGGHLFQQPISVICHIQNTSSIHNKSHRIAPPRSNSYRRTINTTGVRYFFYCSPCFIRYIYIARNIQTNPPWHIPGTGQGSNGSIGSHFFHQFIAPICNIYIACSINCYISRS